MVAVGSYFIVPLIGPDGAGKSTLLQAITQTIAARDPSAPRAPRSVSVSGLACDVLDVRTANEFVQIVDFPDAEAQRALLPTSGASAVVIVIDVKESVMPATVDAVLAAHMLGLRIAAAVVTQCDAIDDMELADLVAMEVGEMLAKYAPQSQSPTVVTVGARAAIEGAKKSRAAMQTLLHALGCG